MASVSFVGCYGKLKVVASMSSGSGYSMSGGCFARHKNLFLSFYVLEVVPEFKKQSKLSLLVS